MKQKIFLIGLLVFFTILLLGYYFWKCNNHRASYQATDPKLVDFNFELCSKDEPYEEHRIIKDLITKNEAQELIDWARPKLKEATVISYSGKDLSHRNNTVTWLDKSHPISKKIVKKVSAITGFLHRILKKCKFVIINQGNILIITKINVMVKVTPV